jgi:hypothetical protein
MEGFGSVQIPTVRIRIRKNLRIRGTGKKKGSLMEGFGSVQITTVQDPRGEKTYGSGTLAKRN